LAWGKTPRWRILAFGFSLTRRLSYFKRCYMCPTPDNTSSSRLTHRRTSAPPYRICGKPIPVEAAKTDADGNAIHEECYALKVKFETATKSTHYGRADGATDGTATRPWKVIAEEASRECDPKKMAELISELNRALDEQTIGKRKDGQSKPDSK
jgi:hypothetical protein